jgi:hypothetical protein
MAKKEYRFSKHFLLEKGISVDLAIDCIHTGKKISQNEANKFKSVKEYSRGKLAIVFRESEEYFFIITGYWYERQKRFNWRDLWNVPEGAV